MKVIGILRKYNNLYCISCDRGKFPISLSNYIRCNNQLITLSNIPLSMLDAAVNQTAAATVDFNRPCNVEGFEFWLKNDLKIVNCLLEHYAEKKLGN